MISWREPWGEERHTVTFEEEDKIDDHGNEGMDLLFTATSDDGMWEFGLDVYAEATYPVTGDVADWDWNSLEIGKGDKFKKDVDEGTCGYSIDGKGGDKPAGPHLFKDPKSLKEMSYALGYLDEQLGPRMSNPRPTGPSDDEDLRLEPEDDSYEDGTEFYDDDLRLDPEDGVVDEVELEDLDFETLKAAFPKFYQNEKFTRTQPNGEEGPYYSDSISFPNLDDSTMEIGDSSALEDWKDKVLRRFGNVTIEFNDEAKNHFDRVFVHSDDFNDARDGFIKGKMSAMQRDEEKGFMTEQLQIRAGIIK